MHSATTTSEMSPSELAKCRENLKPQWENRRVDEALLRRAWETAHRIATVLYQDYEELDTFAAFLTETHESNEKR